MDNKINVSVEDSGSCSDLEGRRVPACEPKPGLGVAGDLA